MRCKSMTSKGKPCKLEGKYIGYCHVHFQTAQDSCCPICFDTIDSSKDFLALSCNHFFHKKCIQTWILRKNECPLCRAVERNVTLCHKLGIQRRRTGDEPVSTFFLVSQEPIDEIFNAWFTMFSIQEIIQIVSCFDNAFRPLLIDNLLEAANRQDDSEYIRELISELIQL